MQDEGQSTVIAGWGSVEKSKSRDRNASLSLTNLVLPGEFSGKMQPDRVPVRFVREVLDNGDLTPD